MHKIIFLTVLIVLYVSSRATAQAVFKAGVTAGFCASQYDGDTYSGYHKLGFCGGAYLRNAITEKFDGQFEINFIQKGSIHQPKEGNLNHYKLMLNYIEVPLLLRYHYKKIVFEGGVSEGVLFGYKEFDNYADVTSKRPMHKFETAFLLGITYPIYNILDFSWRYSYSLLPVRSHESGATYLFNFGEYNNVLIFTLRYTFKNAPSQQ